jgi:hypothetical protein
MLLSMSRSRRPARADLRAGGYLRPDASHARATTRRSDPASRPSVEVFSVLGRTTTSRRTTRCLIEELPWGRITPTRRPKSQSRRSVWLSEMCASRSSTITVLSAGAPGGLYLFEAPRHHHTILRGKQVECSMQVAATQVGGVHFELIEPLDGPSIYKEFLETHGQGVHHIACSGPRSGYEENLEYFESNGLNILMGGRIGDSVGWWRRIDVRDWQLLRVAPIECHDVPLKQGSVSTVIVCRTAARSSSSLISGSSEARSCCSSQ